MDASGIVGLVIGLSKKRLNVEDGEFGRKKVIVFNIYQVIANAVAWLLVAPALDILIYAEPAKKVFTQGAVSFGFNIVMVGILGSILIATYVKTRVKKGSLDRE